MAFEILISSSQHFSSAILLLLVKVPFKDLVGIVLMYSIF